MPTPEPPAPTPSATMCPNPHCHNGRVGALTCAVCKGEVMRETSHTPARHITLDALDEPYMGPVGKHGPYGTHTNLDGSPVPPASAPAATAGYPDACTRDGGAVCDAAGEVCPCMKDSPARPAATAGTEPQVGDEFVEMEASDGEWSELVATITRVIEPSPDRKGCWLVEWMEPGSDRVPAVFTEKYGEEFGKARYRQTLIEFRDGRWRRPIYADDLTCPCGAALVREGEVVKSHWKGAICGDCEAVLFARHPSSRPAAPSGEEAETPTRIEPCHHCENGNAIEVCETTTAQWGTECPPVEIEDTLWRCQSCGAAWYDAKQSQRHTRTLLRATIGAQATELAALRARVEEQTALLRRVEHDLMTVPYNAQTPFDVISEVVAALRAALAPRQTTEGHEHG